MTTETFGKPDTASEALALWDAGDVVWTAEMGGLGPGYEQCIHVMAFEIIRELLSRGPLDWYWTKAEQADTDADAKRECRAFADSVEQAVMPRISGLGSSGAQWGAAQNLAYIVVRKGWAAALSELPEDRLTMVSKAWPRVESSKTADAVARGPASEAEPSTRA